MALRIGVLGNSQVQGLAASLRALLPGSQVVAFEAGPSLAPPGVMQAAQAALAECDHVFAQELPERWSKLAAAVLAKYTRPVHLLPPVEFSGFHPDSMMIAAGGQPVTGPTGILQSRIAVLGYLAGYSVAATVALYNRLVFARLGYLRAYREQSAALLARFAAHNIDIAPLQAGWVARGCFMHAPEQPKITVLLDLARLACAMMGVPPVRAGVAPAQVADHFANAEAHPVFSDIAAAAGVAPEGVYRAPLASRETRRTMSIKEFVAGSFRCFETQDVACLQGGGGVAAGLAALRLPLRPPPRRMRALQPAMSLMSCHGTVLRQAAVPGAARHLPLNVPPRERPLLTLDFPNPGELPDAPRLHGFTSPLLGGVRVAPGAVDGLVAFWRGEQVLCAERDDDSAGFTRSAVGPWEGFLPVRAADMDVLFTLAAHDWRLAATGETVPRISVRLAPGYALWFGRWRIDLRTEMPCLDEAAADGCARARLMLAGEPMVAVAEWAAAASKPAPASTSNAATGAPPLALGQQRMVTGAPTLLSLPMVCCTADRRWLYETYEGARPVPAGRFVHAAVLRRAAGIALRFDAAGGVRPVAPSANQDGAGIAGQSVLAVPPGMPIGAGWVEAALRLSALWPYLPLDARLLLPQGGVPVGVSLAWQELGVARAPALAPGELCVVEDMVWLGQDSAAQLPAELLTSFRDRARGVAQVATDPARRIFVHGAGAVPSLIAAMQARGFVPVDLAALSPLAQMATFAGAAWVVGTTGLDLAGLAFCAIGTRVIELAGPRFAPSAWMLAGKLGLNFAVVPSRDELDLERFDALTTMLANREL